jgi:hypothetical protein
MCGRAFPRRPPPIHPTAYSGQRVQGPSERASSLSPPSESQRRCPGPAARLPRITGHRPPSLPAGPAPRTSALEADPDPGPRLRHRGLRAPAHKSGWTGLVEWVLLAGSAQALASDITSAAPRTTGPSRMPTGAAHSLGPLVVLPCACPRRSSRICLLRIVSTCNQLASDCKQRASPKPWLDRRPSPSVYWSRRKAVPSHRPPAASTTGWASASD